MKRNKLYLILIALLALGQTAWAQQTQINVGTEDQLRTHLESYTECTINLMADIVLNSGNINVNYGKTLNMNGRTISVHPEVGVATRLFNVQTGAQFTISGTGNLSGHTNTSDGGLIYLNQNATLTLSGATLNLNINGSVENGGAIYNNGGTVNLLSATLTAICANGVNVTNGGIIYNAGTLAMNSGTTTLSGGHATNGGALYVNSGNFTAGGETTFSNNTATNGGALYVNGGTASCSADFSNNTATNGGAIYNAGTLNLDGGNIGGIDETDPDNPVPHGNTADNQGGGIYSTGSLTLNGGSISSNTAGNGGGIHSAGGSITMTGGSISYNSATGNCGGVNLTNATTMTMSGGSIDNNHSDANDGGMYIGNGSSLTMSGGSISGNSANYNAGVRVAGTMTMSGGSIANNTANNSSGGVHINSGSTLNMTGGSITGNTAPNYAGIRVNGTLNMSGGSVTSNTATTDYGGIRVEGTLRMSGSPIVIGNTVGDNSNNVSLSNNKNITVNGAFAMGALIGVTHDNTLATFTSGFIANNPNPEMVFISDNETCRVVINGNEAALIGISAPGAFNGKYIDENGTEHTCSNYTLMSYFINNNLTPNLSSGWYVVDQNLTFNDRITITDSNVNLILMDNTRLDANKGVFVSNGKSLEIWAQSDTPLTEPNPMGMLYATSNTTNYSGLGGSRGDEAGAWAGAIYIHGGSVVAIGGNKASGIFTTPVLGDNYSLIISGGQVIGVGGDGGAGIGGCREGICGGIKITGGVVSGCGGLDAAGIGSGYAGRMYRNEPGYSGNPTPDGLTHFRITGGYVTGWGKLGAGIGGGRGVEGYEGCAPIIYIDGGTVTAYTEDGAVIEALTQGAVAIGWGYNGMDSYGYLHIYDGAKVLASTSIHGTPTLQTAENGRGDNCRRFKQMRIEPCDHPYGTSYSDNGSSLDICDYCYTKEPYTFRTAGSWNTASNWLGSIMPGAGKDVAVKAAATIPSSYCAHVDTIYMQDGGSLTIADGGQLKHSNAVPGTFQKFVQGFGENVNQGGWYLLKEPITRPFTLDKAIESGMVGGTLDEPDFTGVDLYSFRQTNESEWFNWKTEIDHFINTGIIVNSGWLYAHDSDVTLNFIADEQHPFVSTATDTYVTATRNPDQTVDFIGWNLIGNPFTCDAYLASGRDFYRMNADGDAIVLATDENGGNVIKPCEGIFVVIGADDPETSIPLPGMPTQIANIQFTTTEPEPSGSKGLLDIKVMQEGQLADVARVRFGKGDRTDKIVLRDNATLLSIKQDGKDYSVVYNEAQGEIALSFKAKADGQYTLSVDPAGVDLDYLHLIDNLTGADVDLLPLLRGTGGLNPSAAYTFEAKTTDDASRFKLVFSTK